MKYYINGMQVPRKQFFEFLTYDVYYDWTNNANSDFCFEDYYGFVKEKIRSGITYSVINTYASEREIRKWK